MPTRHIVSLAAIFAGLALGAGCSSQDPTAQHPTEHTARAVSALSDPTLQLLGSFHTTGAIEISAYDRNTRRLFSVNSIVNTIEVIDISDPSAPVSAGVIPAAGVPNSVAVYKGLVAVASAAPNRTDPGSVTFYDAATLAMVGQVTVGAGPDMITFTPNGKTLLVANEGEPADNYAVDPEGSVSLIDVKTLEVTTVPFLPDTPLVNQESIRIFGGGGTFGGITSPPSTPAQDFEPEYITVSDDGHMAYVTLQENNAIAILDLKTQKFTSVVGLGLKDHPLPGNGLDASDRDGPGSTPLTGNIQNWPIKGMYQPDSIGHFKAGNTNYLIMSNEGDAREWGSLTEDARVRDLVNAGRIRPDHPVVTSGAGASNAKLGRLTVTTRGVPLDSSGRLEDVWAFGARSFTIRDTNGNLVWDSGDQIERKISELLPGWENSDQSASPARDTRSDNKGPEPEGLAVAKVKGRHYAFIGLERVGGVLMYEIEDPHAPRFITYVNNRSFTTPTNPGDLGPEGLMVIENEDSPNMQPVLVVSNEISGTATLYQINTGD